MVQLTRGEALELFSWNAMKNDKVHPDCIDKLNLAENYTSGVPLASKVLGPTI